MVLLGLGGVFLPWPPYFSITASGRAALELASLLINPKLAEADRLGLPVSSESASWNGELPVVL